MGSVHVLAPLEVRISGSRSPGAGLSSASDHGKPFVDSSLSLSLDPSPSMPFLACLRRGDRHSFLNPTTLQPGRHVVEFCSPTLRDNGPRELMGPRKDCIAFDEVFGNTFYRHPVARAEGIYFRTTLRRGITGLSADIEEAHLWHAMP